jgi:UDP-galactopyranose mutase
LNKNERAIRSLTELRAERAPGDGLLMRRAAMDAVSQNIRWFSEKYVEMERGDRGGPDLVCFSHLRWNSLQGRPQHLMTRCAGDRRIFFVEEPVYSGNEYHLVVNQPASGLWVVVPHLPETTNNEEAIAAQESMLTELFREFNINDYTLWYCTPRALQFTRGLRPLATVYDCAAELHTLGGDTRLLKELEEELLHRADIVFAAGKSLFNTRCAEHSNIHYLPDGVDLAHFAQARHTTSAPADQAQIPHPRIGYSGPIDECLDLNLLGILAEARPDWQFVLIGPIAVEEAKLPKHSNIHYLGPKEYNELPAYMAGWNAAMLPFVRNSATRYVNPALVAMYLAAGRPIVSTSVWDVVHPYGEEDLVRIADTLAEFIIAAADLGMDETCDLGPWTERADQFLENASWDRTWREAMELLESTTGIRCYSASRGGTATA